MSVRELHAPAEALALEPDSLSLRPAAAPLLEPQLRLDRRIHGRERKVRAVRNHLAQLARPKPANPKLAFQKIVHAEQRPFVRIQTERIAAGVLADDEQIIADGADHVAITGQR
jgi:hypothetical protein